MAEVDRSIYFNAFHILLVSLIGIIINNSNFDFIIYIINYIINIDTPGFWVLMMHIFIVYIVLISIKIEIGFRAAISFNL